MTIGHYIITTNFLPLISLGKMDTDIISIGHYHNKYTMHFVCSCFLFNFPH